MHLGLRRRLGLVFGFLRPQHRFSRESIRLYRSNRRDFALGHLLPHYSAWKKTAFGTRSPLEDGIPWLAFASIEHLKKSLTREMRVFEYGSGGSTVFYAGRVAQVDSVEHDREWYEHVCTSISERGIENCRVRYIGSKTVDRASSRDASRPEDYASLYPGCENQDYSEYARAIDDFPEEHFDLVVVDGRARPSCAKHAMPKVKPGGLILFDNAERPHYQPIQQELDNAGWIRLAFYGPHTYRIEFSCTTFWKKPA